MVEPAAAKRQRISPLPFLLFIDYTRFLLTPDPSYARRSGRRRHGALYAQGIIEKSIENQQFFLFTPLQSCIFSYVVCHNSFGQIQYNRCKGSNQFILPLTLVGGNFLFIIEKQKIPPFIILSITIRITRNPHVQQLVKTKYNMQSPLCAVSISSLHTSQLAAIAA